MNHDCRGFNEETGKWEPVEPLPFLGWKANLEQWFYSVRLNRLARFMAWWDERGLGK